ncbi:dihydroxyacetone kinase subunit DhaK [Oceanobacillus sp. CFH 90083]|uniref:dihydroxyacetone kinase subunit DhaK n=1 Tax=Oceanobacillus sp. CFH 90083 TaxID=2592336 RepID=UPI00128D15B1|nr:dihydroxyacetone kinase subunit DhaK [Oceanobacillus sp. CFH 90083]
MQRFINNPEFIVDDLIKGYVKAYKGFIEKSANNDRVVKRKNSPETGKVGIVTGGGSGHEPAFLGYVGENMVDAVAVGEVFASPPAEAFYDAILEADSGEGVACLFGNYAGDNMNVKMAIQMAEEEGVNVKFVTAKDDIASSPKETRHRRHGIAGGVYMWKAGGAKAALGGTLDDVIAVAQKAADNTRSICVGLSSCTIPAAGTPNFEIEEGMMEIGIGHHGEPGIRVEKLKSAAEIAAMMTDALLDDFAFDREQNIAVLLSGLGSTPKMELYVLYDAIEEVLKKQNHRVEVVLIGDYATSLDMNGISLSLMKLDNELKELLAYPAKTSGLTIIRS